MLQLRGARQTLCHMAAGNAFRPLSVPRLQELARLMDLDIPISQALREPDLVKALVLHFRPGITDEAVKKILELREPKMGQIEDALESELCSAENAVVGKVLQQDDQKVEMRERQHDERPPPRRAQQRRPRARLLLPHAKQRPSRPQRMLGPS